MKTDLTGIAAFDFDGTLARGDSLLPFLIRLLGGKRTARSVLAHAPAFGMIGIGKGNRDLTKEKFIAHTLSGHSAEEIHAIGKEFANQLIQTRLFDEANNKLRWHKSQGHQTVLVSATLDVYLVPLAERLGIDTLLCTRLEIIDGKATGKLIGVNVRGAEKARQLNDFLITRGLDLSKCELWAYGNSSGDHEMLALAHHPFMVNKRGQLRSWAPAR